MSEDQDQLRRRRQPAVSPSAPGAMPEETARPATVRISSSGDDEPSWMRSAGSVSGAAERRAGRMPEARTEKRARPQRPAADHKAQSRPAHTGRESGFTITVADPAKRKPVRRKKSRRLPWVKIAVLALLAVGICAGLVYAVNAGTHLIDVKKTLDKGENTFYGNLYMNGIPLEGMTLDQAQQVVNQQVADQVNTFCITLHTQDGRTWNIRAEDLHMQYSAANQLDQLWAIGHTGNSRERYEQVKALEDNPKSFYTTLSYDLSTVNQILTSIKDEVDVPAVNATRVDDDTKWPPYSYTDDVPGQTLDISGLNERITGMVESLSSGTVELTPTRVEAKVTRSDLEGQIVKLATYETAIGATSHEGRFTNIQVGTEKFNHLIVKSGESCSFNKVTGKRTEANGFVEAPEIAYGEYVMGVGGGICQVSSTLYNCVVNAGLEVTKRTQHSLASSYVPMGQDATVSNDRLDFVFRNNTNASIFIETQYYKKKNYWYTQFTIYGRPDPNGNSYKLDSQVRETIPLPEPVYKKDKEMTYVVYDDQTYQISKGEEGYIVDVYLVTMNAKGLEVSRELAYTDTYKAVAPVFYRGIVPRETAQ